MLGNWDVVNLRTIKFSVLSFTVLAGKDFEFVNYIFVFVSKVGVEFIIHWGLLKNADEFIVIKKVKN